MSKEDVVLVAGAGGFTKLRDGMEKTYRWIYDRMVARQAVYSSV